MTARLVAAVMVASGIAMAVLAFRPWYSARVPDGIATATGISASGELWSLPPLGAVAALAGGALIALGAAPGTSPARWAGGFALAAGALGVAWAVRNGLEVPVRVAVLPSQPAPDAAVRVEPAAYGAVAAGAAAALAGVLALLPERRR